MNNIIKFPKRKNNAVEMWHECLEDMMKDPDITDYDFAEFLVQIDKFKIDMLKDDPILKRLYKKIYFMHNR